MPRPANPTLADDILTTALGLVERKGPTGFTMREVAGELGYSATAIYQHFISKEALLLALKLQAGDLLAEEMEVARREATLEVQLHSMAHRYLEFGLQNPAYYRLIFQDTLPSLQPHPEHHERMQRAWAIVRETLADWIKACGVSGITADHEANVVWAIVHGVTSLALSNRLPFSERGTLHTLLDLALDHWASGVLSGPAPLFPTGGWHVPGHSKDLASKRSERHAEPRE
jgi:AcrR family transcriptional regulator